MVESICIPVIAILGLKYQTKKVIVLREARWNKCKGFLANKLEVNIDFFNKYFLLS